MSVSPPKLLAGTPDTIFVLVSDDTQVHLCALNANGTVLDSLQTFAPPPAAGADATNWLSPPAVVASHPMNRGGPMIFLTTDGTELEGYSWDPATQKIGVYSLAKGKTLAPSNSGTAPAVSVSGELVIANIGSLSGFKNPGAKPDWKCLLTYFTIAPQPPALYLDESTYNIYLTDGNTLWLIRSCDTLGLQVVHGASAPVATWDRVHVSNSEGLHTFDFDLSAVSHVIAPVNSPNLMVSQPAVAPDGTLYECGMEARDGEYSSYLRAFGGSTASRPNG